MIFLALCYFIATATITFDSLSDFQDKEIEIRGFLYRTLDGNLILADEPNLKSCCVGVEKNQHKQIHVKSDVLEPQAIVAHLSGTLHVHEGRYVLEDVHLKEKPATSPYLLGLLGGIGILSAYFYVRTRKKSAVAQSLFL